MPSVNELLADAGVRHAIDLERYSNGVVQRIVALLNAADDDILRKLAAAIEKGGTATSVRRLEQLLVEVRTINVAAYRKLGRALTAELAEFVEYELEWQQGLFESTVPLANVSGVGVATVEAATVHAAALARPFQGVLLKEALEGLETGRAQAIRDAVRMGVLEGDPLPAIVRRIKGTQALGYTDGLLQTSRHHVEALVRTAVNHTANYTKQRHYEANSDLVKQWVFTATLDSRVSVTCASLHGKKFPIGEGPMPPRHWNCRSVAAPVVKSWRELGIPIDEIPPGTRASMDGQVPADMTFSKWLRSKPAAMQDDILGAARGRLFRANNIDVTRFTNNKGIVYTIEQLKKRDAGLFTRAGLSI